MLSHDDLDRLNEQCGDRVIKRSMYCARCGYNLRSLPYRYNCPECGNRYHARTIRQKGIFLENETRFPISECVISIFAGLMGAGLFYVSIRQWSILGFRVNFIIPFVALVGLALVVVSLVYAFYAMQLFFEYKARHRVSKRVAEQRREEVMHD